MSAAPKVAPSPAETGVSVLTDDLLAACVHCGFCVPVCPTWDILREENDSPRGRLYLMRAEAEDRLDPGGAFALHLGRCLGCRACESVCPAGVPYGHLLEQARARIPVGPMERRLGGWLLDLLTTASLAPRTYAVARFLRRTGLASAFGRILPGTLGRALRLLAATRPRASSVAVGPGSAGSGDPPGESGPGGETRESGPAGQQATYALLLGCVMEGLFAHVHGAARRSLRVAGYREVPVTQQSCCGALHAHAGRMETARELARRNIQAFEAAPDAAVVTDSAGCGAALRDYPAWLSDDPEWRERAVALADRVRDVTELLVARRTSPAVRLEGRVAYDAPCHLHHGQGVRTEPLQLLRSVDGLTVEPLPSSERCCGGAGLYNLAEPELAERVLEPKVDEIERGGYDWVVTGNPGCIMYIGSGLRRAGCRTPVVHPVELIDAAWRAPQQD